MPLVPLYGNFPVKLRTYIGDPIPYEPNITAEQLAEKVTVCFLKTILNVVALIQSICMCPITLGYTNFSSSWEGVCTV